MGEHQKHGLDTKCLKIFWSEANPQNTQVFELAFNEETNERKMWQKANNKAAAPTEAGLELGLDVPR